MTNNLKSEVLTAEELSELFSVPVRTIVRMAKDGKIPSLKVGGKWRFHREAIEKWMKESSLWKRRRRVLIVEDLEADRQAMRRSLEKFEVSISEAESVDEAIKILRHENFDCIILDIYFGEGQKNGITLIEWLDRNGIDVPIVIYTAYDDPRIISEVLKYGGFFVLSKPVSRDRLQKAMEKVLSFGGRS